MCGISGIFYFEGQAVDPRHLAAMNAVLEHRGPDDYGYAFMDHSGRCVHADRQLPPTALPCPLALAHRRLSIVDLSPTGWQPMADADQRYWIVYNGEIYNHIELRQELQAQGYTFRGTCDTEVILKAYQMWGAGCVEHFNGMWAFALWDVARQTLFCSRDRVGVKPFYYYLNDKGLTFASEIKALLMVHDHLRQVNQGGLARFMITGRMSLGADTLFTGVEQLPPGHCLEVSRRQRRIWRYWDIPGDRKGESPAGNLSLTEAAERFRSLLDSAVRLRLRADVPVGVCLSGGMDSSSITALAAQALPRINTFTVAFEEPDFAEGHFAREVSWRYQTDAHHIAPHSQDYIDFLEPFSWYHDEPSPGPALFAQWYVMRLAAQHVKVVLDGQGADELVGGYGHYYHYYLADLCRQMFRGGGHRLSWGDFRGRVHEVAGHLGQSPARIYYQIGQRLRYRQLISLAGTLPGRLKNWRRRHWPGEIAAQVCTPELRRHLAAMTPPPRRFNDDLNEILYRELTRENIPQLMQYGDRTSMAFSIESRVPFLDYRLLEFCSTLPIEMKINGWKTKFLLRQAMRHDLPDTILERKDKKAYPNPFPLWLKGPLYDFARDILTSPSLRQRGWFEPNVVRDVLEAHRAGRANHSWLLWRLLNTEIWARAFFDDFTQKRRQLVTTNESSAMT